MGLVKPPARGGFRTSHAQAGTVKHVLVPPNVAAHGQRNKTASHHNRNRTRHRRPVAAAQLPQGPPVGPLAYLALHVATTRKGL